MKIEHQVCTLEQAKQIMELGILQKSLFYYNQELTPSNLNLHLYGFPQDSIPVYISYSKKSNLNKVELNVHISGGDNYYFEYSAFTVAELGAMLPEGNGFYVYPGFMCKASIIMFDKVYDYRFSDVSDFRAETEAQARAAMLIYLLENKLTTPSEVNHRLKQ